MKKENSLIKKYKSMRTFLRNFAELIYNKMEPSIKKLVPKNRKAKIALGLVVHGLKYATIAASFYVSSEYGPQAITAADNLFKSMQSTFLTSNPIDAGNLFMDYIKCFSTAALPMLMYRGIKNVRRFLHLIAEKSMNVKLSKMPQLVPIDEEVKKDIKALISGFKKGKFVILQKNVDHSLEKKKLPSRIAQNIRKSIYSRLELIKKAKNTPLRELPKKVRNKLVSSMSEVVK